MSIKQVGAGLDDTCGSIQLVLFYDSMIFSEDLIGLRYWSQAAW